jgi:glucose-1-phosphate adenylyltransferase
VDFSILFAGVKIEKGATVRDSIIMPNTTIKSGAVIEYSIIGEDCVVGEGTQVGARPETIEDKDNWGVAVIGHEVSVSANSKIAPKAMVAENQ